MNGKRWWSPLSVVAERFRSRPRQSAVWTAEFALICALFLAMFRNAFSSGVLVTPDLFRSFPSAASYNDLGAYFSKWSPANLGSESASSGGQALLAFAAQLGLLGVAMEAVFVAGFVGVSLVSVWILVKPYVRDPVFAPLAPILYLLSPTLFTTLFDANIQFVLYALLPALVLLLLSLSRRPTWRRMTAFALVVALACAFVPFTPILILPMVGAVVFAGQVVNPSKDRLWRTLLLTILSLGVSILLNAPYYLGNLSYFTSQGIAGAVEANRPVVAINYGWSSPTNLLSLVGAGLYSRYADYYPALAVSSLLIIPAFAFLGAIPFRGTKGLDLRLPLGTLGFLSLGWVSLTRGGFTTGIFEAAPYLLVFNYPSIFYLNCALAFVVLAVCTVDDLHAWSRSKSTAERAAHVGAGVAKRRDAAIARATSAVRSNVGVLSALVLIGASVVPAGFYIGTGDFRLFEAPARIGFPAPWAATAPPSFARIYTFLQDHGGDRDARTLVLPAPAFSGGNTLPGYSLNLFDQKRFLNSVYTGPFFLVPAAQEYATIVLDYLISNRTEEIGLALGQASVRYVFVDKELTFSGPPRWVWDSLVGAPSAFLALLEHQRDLLKVYDDPLITVYENLEFRPYIQGYPGVILLREGSAAIKVDETVFTWGFAKPAWSSPLPPTPLGDVIETPDGYLVYAPNGGGSVEVQFSTARLNSSLTAVSSRYDGARVYFTSAPVPVRDTAYVVTALAAYSGPQIHQGGFLFVAGWNSNLTYLWQTDACCPTPVGRSRSNISFDPRLLDPLTAFVTVTAMLPYDFGGGPPAAFQVSNVSLVATSRPPPPPMLAPILIGQLPGDYPPRMDAAVLWNRLSPTEAQQISDSGLGLDRLCLGLCPQDSSVPWDQLIFAYNSLGRPSNASIRNRDPEALSGVSFAAIGPSRETLALGGFPFRSIYVRARGSGTIMTVPGGTIAVASSEYGWYSWSSSSVWTNSTVSLAIAGALQLDSFLVVGRDVSAGGPPGGSQLNSTFSQDSLTEYHGQVDGSTKTLLLSQSFNPGWSLQVGTRKVLPVHATGWANLFLLSPGLPTNGSVAFVVSYGPQTVHEALVTVQFVGTLLATSFVLMPWARKAIPRARTLWLRIRGGG